VDADSLPGGFAAVSGLGVVGDRWDKDWPAERKIAAIQRSYWLHRRKGTRAAVRRVIEDMGFSATFAEWFEVGDEPGTFRLEVDVNEVGLTQKTLAS
jgi:phage tail P2-like protein